MASNLVWFVPDLARTLFGFAESLMNHFFFGETLSLYHQHPYHDPVRVRSEKNGKFIDENGAVFRELPDRALSMFEECWIFITELCDLSHHEASTAFACWNLLLLFQALVFGGSFSTTLHAWLQSNKLLDILASCPAWHFTCPILREIPTFLYLLISVKLSDVELIN